jgi:hypothetical protein
MSSTRVVIIVLDQARPDTIDRYGMENVQALQRAGASFPNALVGHMAAETVISHNVITSGKLPRHMGWSNVVYRHSANVLGNPGARLVDVMPTILETMASTTSLHISTDRR